MKVVNKPWGREEWIELNDGYCYKRIYINAGHRTSLEYHKDKMETNFIVKGEGLLSMKTDGAKIVNGKMIVGDYYTVIPKTEHRIKAVTDLIMMEVSTPEVDDVIRLEDDYGRADYKYKTPEDLPRPKGYEDYKFPFTLLKPWGTQTVHELWVDDNGRGYCFMRNVIKEGCQTSYMYHKDKIETTIIISGTAEVWNEDEKGEIIKRKVGPGDSWTDVPPTKHRIHAITDLVFDEASTTEVDDVIRIDDEFGRPNGKVKEEHDARLER